jgi:methylamine dehydrogenase accessory protein MauD
MTGLWLASYLALWGLVVVICLFLVGVLRQLGAMQLEREQRLSQLPPGLPSLEQDGPAIGARMPDLTADTINGHGTVNLETLREEGDTLLMFMSPMCEICQHVVEPLNALVEESASVLRSAVIMRADEQACHAFVSVFPLVAPVICDSDRTITMGFGIHRTPFGLLYGSDGRLIRKGLIEEPNDLQALLGRESASPTAQARIVPAATSTGVYVTPSEAHA